MNDPHRDLERRWRETGGLDEEVAYLRARMREGSLATGRVRLAAYVGYEPACRAVGGAEGPDTIGLWAWGLKDVAHLAAAQGDVPYEATCLRAGVAIARRCARDAPDPAMVEYDLGILERWLLAPDAATLAAVVELRVRHEGEGRMRPAFAQIVRLITRVVSVPDPEKGSALSNCANLASDLLRSPERVREAVREELVPWLLGRGDPVAERGRSGRSEPHG